ncbi:nonribosomal peptide synthase, putative [Talaromyces stipitatus ATCC 10500]|uniref:Nonribosomal peptide synthase, putative n=1 Tax=Talaromyces stipitatus (strain ATCC 10500 / CBS 375.48 / QM 6759 / NRRL 1006) TaxID=441959 RepID=B8LZU2_TALSN|nr:nonribosomal peptide synthase, putative [Talaromyces stipitatus ATCC 10500]EED20874.1 nonribosomal peptide synthase, putative [Talaromyces stipitatus ATCC 10500]
MASVATPILEITNYESFPQERHIESITNDENRYVAIPRTHLPTINATLDRSFKSSDVACIAWALAVRCYTCDSVTFALEDCHLKRLISVYSSEFQTVKSVHDAIRAQLAKSDSSSKNLDVEENSSQLFRSRLIDHGELKKRSMLDRDSLEHVSEYDITVHVSHVANELEIVLAYKPSAEDLAMSTADTLCQTLDMVVNHPSADLAKANFLGPKNLRMISEWTSNPADPSVACAHELFRRRAELQPGSLAIDSWDSQMTYGELDSLTTRLSFLLVEAGVNPDIIVPLCFEKSAWYVVAMIAVLKAGGAFVPLDPAHPPARLQEIVSQVNPPVILTSSKNNSLFTHVDVNKIIINDDLASRLPTQPSEDDRVSNVTPENLAYVIFTSGSTGMPKGTMIEHQSFCSGALRQGEAARMSSNSRIFQFASYAFDVSILEILTGLIFGACICVPDDQLDRADLARSMNDFRANWAFLTPSVLKIISPEQLPLLKTLIVGGEPMSQSDISTWAGKLQLMNGYGPSECSVAAAANTDLTPHSSPQNIGKAIGGNCWIVDPNNHDILLPVGAVGELLIQGPIVARGYLNDPAKTASVFITNPAWYMHRNNHLWNRFYKTGDLVRYDADGLLHFIGRKDHQVKLNGQRMELGEVEHHLWTDSHVQYGIALVPKSGVCKSRLVGIVSLQSQLSATPTQESREFHLLNNEQVTTELDDISKRLGNLLPPYMVPTIWIPLDHFPITSSGKLDRKAVTEYVTHMSLEAFQSLMGSVDNNSDSKSLSQSEKFVRKIWSDILKLSEDKIHQNSTFLSLGGDSITAMAATSELRKFGTKVTIADILKHNLTKVADILEESAIAGIFQDGDVDKKTQELPVSPYQRLLLDRLLEGDTNLHHVTWFKLEQKSRLRQIIHAFDSIVYAHPALGSHFYMKDDLWLQRFVIHDELDTPSYHLNVSHISGLHELHDTLHHRQATLDTFGHPNFLVDVFIAHDAQYISVVAHAAAVDSHSLTVIVNSLRDTLKSLPDDLGVQTEHGSKLRQDFFDSWNHFLTTNTSGRTVFFGASNSKSTASTSAEVFPYVRKRFQLDASHSCLLKGSCNLAFDTTEDELLLTALILSYEQTLKSHDPSNTPVILVEDERITSLSNPNTKTYIGQFSSTRQLRVPVERDTLMTRQFIREIKDKIRLSGSFSSQTETLHSLDIVFKYLDRSKVEDYPFGRPLETADLNGRYDFIVSTPLEVAVTFSNKQFEVVILSTKDQESKLSLFSDKYQENLLKIIEITSSNTQREFTLADLPLLSLDYKALDKLNHEQLSKLELDVDDVDDIYPCSPMQNGLLMSQARHRGSYDISVAWEVSSSADIGYIDIAKLESAWRTVINIHPALRTIFISGFDGKEAFLQVVLKKPRIQTSVVREVDADIESILNQSVDLESQPLTPPHRFAIYVTEGGKVFCRVDASHTIIDGVSKSLILKDLKQAYDGELLSGSPGVKYSDFIRYINTNDSPASISFWKKHLSGIEPCYFPVLTSETTARELRDVSVVLEPSVEAIHNFCASHNITVSNLIQTVWALVLRCFVGRDDVCFGYLASGRDAPVDGIVDMVGPTISVLICRAALDDSSTIKDALRTCQMELLDSLSHQHCSLAEIQHALELSGMALFNTGISFQAISAMDKSIETGSINFQDIVVREPTEYNIALHVTDSPNSLDIKFAYWTDCLSQSQAQSISGTFSSILSSIISGLDSRVDQLNYVGAHDLSQIAAWNEEEVEHSNVTIPDMIYQQISKAPNDVAIQSTSVTLTYEMLGKMASDLSKQLVQAGIGAGHFVPLAFEKSVWAIVSMVAVLATGAAFVPIDPATPIERFREVIDQTGAKFLLTSSKYAHKLKELGQTTIIVNEITLKAGDKITISQEELDRVRPSPHDDAYVIFTSGSTGKPKGCVVQHSAFCSGALVQGRLASLSPASRVLQFASYSFDVSLLEIMTSLMFGACICVPDENLSKDIKRCINQFSINWTFLTPSVLKLLDPADVPSLKTLILGGEPLSKGDILKWADKVQLYNGYGPSECSVAAAANPKLDPNTDPANIGRAIGGVLWVVDSKQPSKLLPIGAVGELLISGPILARGYLNAPDKTAAAFVEQPSFISSSAGKERFYRSGDLVRYNTDGTIHFIGRSDGQVKIRGQRVELGEIEYNIERDENIQHALTLLPSRGPFRKQLLAVVSFKDLRYSTSSTNDICLIPEEHRLEAMEVTTRISDTISSVLPIYMVPALWVAVNRMPMLPSGKLDRKKVRAWIESLDDSTYEQIANMGSQAVGRSPSTPMENLLRAIWANVLNRPEEQISMERSFQSLGGDSISAMQVMSKCRNAKVSLSVKDILQCPTIEQLALRAQPLDKDVDSTEELGMTPFNLSPQQTWEFGLKATCDLNRYNTTFLLSVHSDLDILPYLDATVERHPMLRARFTRDDTGHWVQYIPLDRSNSYLYQTLEVPDMESIKPFIAPNQPGFDLQQGPLFRAITFQLPDKKRFVALTVHHMVIDTVSWRILLQSLEQGLAGEDISSGPSDSFALWCRLLKERAEKEWTPETVLPFQVPTPMYDYWGMAESKNLFETEVIEEFTLDSKVTALLMGKCNEQFRTKPLDIFLAALSYAFSSTFSDRPLPAFFVYSHGRDEFGGNLDISNTIGWFTASTPVVVSPSNNIVESLQAVRDVRASVPGNGVPYWASRWLSEAGNAAFAHHSPFEFSMNYLGQYQQLERDDSLLRYVDLEKPKAQGSGSRLIRTALVETQAIVIADSLQVKFVYNSLMERQAQLREWQENVKKGLLEIAQRLGESK